MFLSNRCSAFDPGTHREAHGTWLSQAGRRRNPSRPPRRPIRLLAQARRSGPLASGESLKWLQIEMEQIGMRKKIELTCRHFVGATASTIAVAPFVRIKPATAQSTEADPPAIPSRQDVTSKTFGLLRQIEAGDLSIGYVDTGPEIGREIGRAHV